MNQVHIEWVENKSADWKVMTVTDPKHGRVDNVSVNRANKEGKPFPNFNSITPGVDIAGDLWKSPAGKWYLFEAKTQGFFQKREGMGEKMMEKKNENIKEAQENKHEAIKMAGAQRDAVLIVTTFYENLRPVELKEIIQEWMRYFLGLQDEPFV